MYMTLLPWGSTARLAHLGQFNREKRPRYAEYRSKSRIQRTPRPLLYTDTSEVYRMRAIAATHHFLLETVCRCVNSNVCALLLFGIQGFCSKTVCREGEKARNGDILFATHGISSKMVCRGQKNQRTSPETYPGKSPQEGTVRIFLRAMISNLMFLYSTTATSATTVSATARESAGSASSSTTVSGWL